MNSIICLLILMLQHIPLFLIPVVFRGVTRPTGAPMSLLKKDTIIYVFTILYTTQ